MYKAQGIYLKSIEKEFKDGTKKEQHFFVELPEQKDGEPKVLSTFLTPGVFSAKLFGKIEFEFKLSIFEGKMRQQITGLKTIA